MNLPAYETIAKPTPAEMQWNLCPCCKLPMPANEAAAFGAHEDCDVFGVKRVGSPRMSLTRQCGVRVVRKALNQQ